MKSTSHRAIVKLLNKSDGFWFFVQNFLYYPMVISCVRVRECDTPSIFNINKKRVLLVCKCWKPQWQRMTKINTYLHQISEMRWNSCRFSHWFCFKLFSFPFCFEWYLSKFTFSGLKLLWWWLAADRWHGMLY